MTNPHQAKAIQLSYLRKEGHNIPFKKKGKGQGFERLKGHKFPKRTLPKGQKPKFDFRGRKDNKNGTVTYV